eukprot:1391231-Pleurochrysis_carterae.AAC.1
MLCAAGTKVTDMVLFATQSRMKCQRRWMCFVFLKTVGSLDRAMASLLYMKRVVGCVCLRPICRLTCRAGKRTPGQQWSWP